MARKRETSTAVGVDLTKALAHGAAGIRKKIRDINRLLLKENLPADLVIANERALKTLKLELGQVEGDKKEKKFAMKYHKVRFFERKKAKRFYLASKTKVEKLKKEIKETEDEEESKKLKRELKKLRRASDHCAIDFAYVLNFPKDEKYLSLYAATNMNNLNEKAKKGIKIANQKKEELKKTFADQIKKGELEISIEDGLKGRDMTEEASNTNTNSKKNDKKNDKKTENVDDAEEGQAQDEDDFFE